MPAEQVADVGLAHLAVLIKGGKDAVRRPVLVELKNNGETLDKKKCTFKTFETPTGPGSAQLTCS